MGTNESKDKSKKRVIIAISLIALIALIIIFGLMKVNTSTAEPGISRIMPKATQIANATTPVAAPVPGILSIRGCAINTETHTATIETRLENLRDSKESFKLFFELSNNGKADKTFLLGPKEKRITDIPFSGAEGNATAYLYHDETGGSLALIQKTSINLTCNRIGDSGSGRVNSDPSGKNPSIDIIDADKKVIYQNFYAGDPWNITLRSASNGSSDYQYSGTVGEQDSGGWSIVFGFLNNNEKSGTRVCASPGSYNVYANGIHNGILIEKNGSMTLDVQNACDQSIDPTPELSSIILISAGLFGIFMISRKYKGN
jgi:hypothetical protein